MKPETKISRESKPQLHIGLRVSRYNGNRALMIKSRTIFPWMNNLSLWIASLENV